MFGRISFLVMTLVLVTSCSRLHGADRTDDPLEKALASYCEKHKMARGKLESYDLDLVPGTKVFRHEISAAPGKEAWMSLSARFAFVFADSKSGRLLEIKRTSREEAPDRFY